MFEYTHEVIDVEQNTSLGCFISAAFAQLFADLCTSRFNGQYIVQPKAIT